MAVLYYVINNNCGYDGDLELALIPESFRTDVLKETLDSKGTNATTYADWYKAVYVPAAESNVATQSASKPAKAVKE